MQGKPQVTQPQKIFGYTTAPKHVSAKAQILHRPFQDMFFETRFEDGYEFRRLSGQIGHGQHS
jgi:hypothetical protein